MVPVGLATGGAAAGALAVELPLQPAQQSAATVVIANTNFIVPLIVTSLRSSSLPEPDKLFACMVLGTDLTSSVELIACFHIFFR
jgi:hypothetical protein